MIAGYYGGNQFGQLRILAANGRMVDDQLLRPRWAGNEIDGPAIAWLARQRGPRIWVSDEQMCSVYGVTPSMKDQVYNLIRQARIRIVRYPREAAKFLR